jgi:prevent-host-death family protein
MRYIDTASARRHLADLVNRVLYTKERITLTRYGKACAVLVPVEDVALLDQPPSSAKRKKERSGHEG